MVFNPLDEVKKAAEKAAAEVKGAAAELVVQQKVAEKLARAQEKYDIPEKYMSVLGGFFTSYMTEVYKAGNDMDKYEALLSQLFQKVLETVKEPYTFAPYHEAIRGTDERSDFDYYALGNEFATGVINNDLSELVGLDKLDEIEARLDAGDNVVLLANHQSEADPQIFSVLLDPIRPGFAEKTIFVAGDRVTTDMIAQPFSMGRNLLCIFSKKHVDNPPELKSVKTKHNRNVMKQMQNLFKQGGKLIWVAPSGGRDRTDEAGRYQARLRLPVVACRLWRARRGGHCFSAFYVCLYTCQVAEFDSKSIEMFRLMADKAGRTTHFYPLSMLTYPICPPPTQVGGSIGESRTVKWSPAGLYFGDRVDLSQYAEGCVVKGFPANCDSGLSRDEAREALSWQSHKVVSHNYLKLEAALAEHLAG
jgi:glycerol-3-phosphate O-acyltransferase